jgi:anti-sigma factor RsiW
VAKETEHDRSVGRLLRAARRSAHPKAASPTCLDPGLIASWAEAALSPEAASRVEAHLADCPRCQAVLAAFARTDVASPAAVPLWKRWIVLVPIAATVAVVSVLWIAWPRPEVPAVPMAAVAQAPPDVSRESPPAPAAPTALPAAAPTAAPARAPVAAPAAAPTAARPAAVASAKPAPQFRSAQAAAQPPPVAAAGAASDRQSTPRAPELQLAAPLEPLAAFESPRDFSPSGGGGGGGRGGAGGAGRVAGAARTAATAEAGSAVSTVTRWRILPSHDLERSTDDGRTWQAVAIDPPPMLISGAAPARLVCWIVGRAGAVLVTTDASHFTRLDFPATVDLAAVQASDALNAVVTTADGRTFVTTDGGRNWTEKTQGLVGLR